MNSPCYLFELGGELWEMDLIEGIKTPTRRRATTWRIGSGLWEMDLIEGIKTRETFPLYGCPVKSGYEKWTW